MELWFTERHTNGVNFSIEAIGKTEAQAITKWLPKSKYRALNKGYLMGKMKSGAPDIEYYGKDGYAEVWIAVKEK